MAQQRNSRTFLCILVAQNCRMNKKCGLEKQKVEPELQITFLLMKNKFLISRQLKKSFRISALLSYMLSNWHQSHFRSFSGARRPYSNPVLRSRKRHCYLCAMLRPYFRLSLKTLYLNQEPVITFFVRPLCLLGFEPLNFYPFWIRLPLVWLTLQHQRHAKYSVVKSTTNSIIGTRIALTAAKVFYR